MEWVERLNQSMNYIEEHLMDGIDVEALGRIACCSSYHFQRMFTYMAADIRDARHAPVLSYYLQKRVHIDP